MTRTVNDRLSVGAELYHRTRDAAEGRPLTGLNLGITYRMTSHFSLLASGGPGLQNARQEGTYGFYTSIKADY